MKFLNKSVILSLSLSTFVGCVGLACQTPTVNVNTAERNTNSAMNTNAVLRNNNLAAGNSGGSNSMSSTIEAKEPEQYQATVTLKLETAGAQSLTFPPLKAEVAKNGADRRMEFVLPNNQSVVYLDKGGRQLIIVPQQKQYAELNKDALGFEVRRLLMPEQIVNQLKNMKGVEKVGEEKIDGRDAIKYRYATTTNTQTQAGKVETESFIFVDKETGLPLRSFTNSAAQGNVQGVNGINLVTELGNVRTTADAALFAEPTDFKKVEPEQIRGQVNLIFNAAAAVIGQIMKSAQPATTTTATP